MPRQRTISPTSPLYDPSTDTDPNEADFQREQDYLQRQQLAQQRQDMAQQRTAVSAARDQQQEQQAQSNNINEATWRTQGVQTYTDANGKLQKITDPISGGVKTTDNIGPQQWDQSGKAYRMERKDGVVQQRFEDADAKLVKNPNDDKDTNLYRENKHAPWEPVDTKAGLFSEDPNERQASANHLKKLQDSSLKQKMDELEAQRPSKELLPTGATKQEILRRLAANEPLLPEHEEPAKALQRSQEISAQKQNLAKEQASLGAQSLDDYTAAKRQELGPEAARQAQGQKREASLKNLHVVERQLADEQTALEAERDALQARQDKGLTPAEMAGHAAAVANLGVRGQMWQAKNANVTKELDRNVNQLNQPIQPFGQVISPEEKDALVGTLVEDPKQLESFSSDFSKAAQSLEADRAKFDDEMEGRKGTESTNAERLLNANYERQKIEEFNQRGAALQAHQEVLNQAGQKRNDALKLERRTQLDKSPFTKGVADQLDAIEANTAKAVAERPAEKDAIIAEAEKQQRTLLENAQGKQQKFMDLMKAFDAPNQRHSQRMEAEGIANPELRDQRVRYMQQDEEWEAKELASQPDGLAKEWRTRKGPQGEVRTSRSLQQGQEMTREDRHALAKELGISNVEASVMVDDHYKSTFTGGATGEKASVLSNGSVVINPAHVWNDTELNAATNYISEAAKPEAIEAAKAQALALRNDPGMQKSASDMLANSFPGAWSQYLKDHPEDTMRQNIEGFRAQEHLDEGKWSALFHGRWGTGFGDSAISLGKIALAGITGGGSTSIPNMGMDSLQFGALGDKVLLGAASGVTGIAKMTLGTGGMLGIDAMGQAGREVSQGDEFSKAMEGQNSIMSQTVKMGVEMLPLMLLNPAVAGGARLLGIGTKAGQKAGAAVLSGETFTKQLITSGMEKSIAQELGALYVKENYKGLVKLAMTASEQAGMNVAAKVAIFATAGMQSAGYIQLEAAEAYRKTEFDRLLGGRDINTLSQEELSSIRQEATSSAMSKARPLAAMAGVVTGLLTTVLPKGNESLQRYAMGLPARAASMPVSELVKKVGLQKLGEFLGSGTMKAGLANFFVKMGIGTADEFTEEFLDELFQQILSANTYEPNKSFGDVLAAAVDAGGMGAIMGLVGGSAEGGQAYTETRAVGAEATKRATEFATQNAPAIAFHQSAPSNVLLRGQQGHAGAAVHTESLAAADAALTKAQQQLSAATNPVAQVAAHEALAAAQDARLTVIQQMAGSVEVTPEQLQAAQDEISATENQDDADVADAALSLHQNGPAALNEHELRALGLARDGKGGFKSVADGPTGLPRVSFTPEGAPIFEQKFLNNLSTQFPAVAGILPTSEHAQRVLFTPLPETAPAAPTSGKAQTQAPASNPSAQAASGELQWDVTVDGQKTPVRVTAPDEAAAVAHVRAMGKGMVQDDAAMLVPGQTSPDGAQGEPETGLPQAPVEAKGTAAFPHETKETISSVGMTVGAMRDEISAAHQKKTGKPVSAAEAKNHAEMAASLGRELNRWKKIFPSVKVISDMGDGGGVQVQPGQGLQLDFERLANTARATGVNAAKWAKDAMQEEVIHAVAVQLEAEGKWNAAELFEKLPDSLKKLVKDGYKSDDSHNLGHEFMRMLIQGEVNAGVLTEFNAKPGLIEDIKAALKALLNYFADLYGNLKKQGADDATLQLIDDVSTSIRAVMDSLDATKNNEQQTKTEAKPETKNTVPRSQKPSPTSAPRSAKTVKPRPENRGEARDLWDDTYGDMLKGGRTHNNDGTPYTPTIFDSVSRQVGNDIRGFDDDQRRIAIGSDLESLRAQNIRELIDNGWNWNKEKRRFENPENLSETPAQGLARFDNRRKSTTSETKTTTETKPSDQGKQTATGPVEVRGDELPNQPAGGLAGPAVSVPGAAAGGKLAKDTEAQAILDQLQERFRQTKSQSIPDTKANRGAPLTKVSSGTKGTGYFIQDALDAGLLVTDGQNIRVVATLPEGVAKPVEQKPKVESKPYGEKAEAPNSQLLASGIAAKIKERGGVTSLSQARRIKGEDWQPRGEWDGAIDADGKSLIRYPGIWATGAGAESAFPDVVANDLGFDTAHEMWEALKQELATAKNLKANPDPKEAEGEAADQEMKKQKRQFKADTKRGEDNTVGLRPSTLEIGDMVLVDGEKMTVTQRFPDGAVMLEDGTKYGAQVVENGDTIYVEDTESAETRLKSMNELFVYLRANPTLNFDKAAKNAGLTEAETEQMRKNTEAMMAKMREQAPKVEPTREPIDFTLESPEADQLKAEQKKKADKKKMEAMADKPLTGTMGDTTPDMLDPNADEVPLFTQSKPAEVSQAPKSQPFTIPLSVQSGGGRIVIKDWRKDINAIQDGFEQVDILRAIVRGEGGKVSDQDLRDVLDFASKMLKEGHGNGNLSNLGQDIIAHPSASVKTKADAVAFTDSVYPTLDNQPDPVLPPAPEAGSESLTYDQLVAITYAGQEANRKWADLTPNERNTVTAFAESGLPFTKQNAENVLASIGMTGAVDREIAAIKKNLPIYQKIEQWKQAEAELTKRQKGKDAQAKESAKKAKKESKQTPASPDVTEGEWIVDANGSMGPVIGFENGVPVIGMEGENEGDVEPETAVAPWRKENAPSSPAKPPVSNDTKPALTPEEQAMKDALDQILDGSLQAQSLDGVNRLYARDIPESAFDLVAKAARGFVKSGIETPEALGRSLTGMGQAYRAFSEAIWSMMGGSSAKVRAIIPDWQGIYEALDTPVEPEMPQGTGERLKSEFPDGFTMQDVYAAYNRYATNQIDRSSSYTRANSDINQWLDDGTISKVTEETIRGRETKFVFASTPTQFKSGDAVQFTKDGKLLTGVVRGSEYEGRFEVKVNQVATAGGVPIGRVELVKASDLSLIATPETLKGDKIDKEWTAFDENSGTLVIPRDQMPQIKSEQRGAMANFLRARGIQFTLSTALPGTLKPTQAEYSQKKVDKARAYTKEAAENGTPDRTLLVSEDNQVVDGHHQWMAALHDRPDQPMKIIRLGAPIATILNEIREMPTVETAAGEKPAEVDTTKNSVTSQNEPNLVPSGDSAETADVTTSGVGAGVGGNQLGGKSGGNATGGGTKDGGGRGTGSGSGSGTSGTVGDSVEGSSGGVDPSERSGNTGNEPVATTNYRITEADKIGEGGLKAKFNQNVAAIRLVKALEAEGRKPTASEQAVLVKYVGWGGMKGVFAQSNKQWSREYSVLKELLTPEEYEAANRSMLDSHYTSPTVVQRGVWAALSRFGFRGGRMVEGGVGIGHFIGMMPNEARANSSHVGIEKDHITAKIAAYLYPEATIHNVGFEAADLEVEFFDASAGNPPFGQQQLFDKKFPHLSKFSIHNYFIAKQLELLRNGGVAGFVVSHNFLDALDPAAREYIATKAQFLGAIRLPNTAFKENANTEVVTDIVFFQKMDGGGDTAWTKSRKIKYGDNEYSLNSYIEGNPDMAMGTISFAGSMYGPGEYSLDPKEGDLGEQLDEAVAKLPKDIYQAVSAETVKRLTTSEPMGDKVKVGSYFVQDGVLHKRLSDVNMERRSGPVEGLNPTAAERIKGIIGIREVFNDLVAAEMDSGTPEAKATMLRNRLNVVYDQFVKVHGYLNQQANRRAFYDDPESARVLGLESDFDPGISPAVAKKNGVPVKKPSAKKAAIFSKRVNSPYQEVTQVSTPQEALAVSMNQRGGVFPSYMAELTGLSETDIMDDLKGLVYLDPSGGYVVAAEYLSGNVRRKLREAKAQGLDENVAALEKVIPMDIEPLDIAAPIGAPWVAVGDYNEFATELGKEDFKIIQNKSNGGWTVTNEGKSNDSLEVWGTVDKPLGSILNDIMNSKPPVVTYIDADDKRVVHKEKTALASSKADLLHEQWKEWIWQDEGRRVRLSRVYNDTYNNYVDPRYDGSHLTLPGISALVKLRAHQKNVAWRIITSGNTLLDHVVGAGKTFAGIAGFMELKRLGRVKKPLFVVPNHLVTQWRDDFIKLYPNANILFARPSDFQKDKRKLLFAKILTGSYDAVIIGHSSLSKIGMEPEGEKALLKEFREELVQSLREMVAAGANGRVQAQLQRQIESVDAKLERLAARTKSDDVVTFEELGIDGMFVDEAHEFKNLFYTTQMQRVAGLGNAAGSAKAFDLFLKTRQLRKKFGGKAPLVFATGTPLSNSLVEMFTLQRYLQPTELEEMGLKTLDAWAKVYAEVKQVYEVDATGTGMRMSTRFANFQNAGELSMVYRTVADVITMKDLEAQALTETGKSFPVPKVNGGKPANFAVPRSEAQADYFGVAVVTGTDAEGNDIIEFPTGSICWRVDNMPDDPREDNMLKLTSDARKAGLDMRLVSPDYGDFPGSKINLAVKEMVKIHKDTTADKGTQLVFCDLSVPSSARGEATKASKAAATSQYWIKNGDNLEIVTGASEVTLDKYPGFSFFVYKSSDKDRPWRIVERRTGKFFLRDKSRAALMTAANQLPSNVEQMSVVVERDAVPLEEITQFLEEQSSANKETDGSEESDVADDTTQTVSMDELLADSSSFSVYDDMKAKLIAAGIPATEIAFIHDFKTPEAKTKLFAAVNAGTIRFLFGSTAKLGAGTNVQKRMVALHHMDAPWRPSDLEQREGRIIRQGNELYANDPEGFSVIINRYATQQTYDTRMWQINEHKARGIEGFRMADSSTRVIEDIGGEAANASDMKSAASGDPLIQREIELRQGVDKLKILQRGFTQNQHRAQSELARELKWPERLEDAKRYYNRMIETRDNGEKKFRMISGGVYFGSEGEGKEKKPGNTDGMTVAFGELVKSGHPSKQFSIGEYRGFRISAQKDNNTLKIGAIPLWKKDDNSYIGFESVVTEYGVNELFNPSGFLTRIDNFLSKFEGGITRAEAYAKESQEKAENLKKVVAQTFPKAAELSAMVAEHAQVKSELMQGRARRAVTPSEADEKPPLMAQSLDGGRDQEYLDAVERGDMETAQRMVDAAAKAAGYNIKAFHGGSPQEGVVTPRFSGIFATDNKTVASIYGAAKQYFIKLTNPQIERAGGTIVGERFSPENVWDELQPNQDGAIIKDIIDVDDYRVEQIDSGEINKEDYLGTVYVLKDPSQIKSADPVTRDESGNVIPLSQRFNPKSDSILQSQSFGDLLTEAGVDLSELDALYDAASQEESGSRTIGNPERSLGGGVNSPNDPVIFGTDQYYDDQFSPQTFEQWRERARTMLEEDYKGTADYLIRYGMASGGAGMKPWENMAAQMIVERESRLPMTPERIRFLQAMVWAYRLSGTEQARTLASRRDPFKTPTERNREFITKMIMTPPAATAKKIEAAESPQEREKLLNADRQRIAKIQRVFQGMGLTLEDVMNGEKSLGLLRSASAMAALNVVQGKAQEAAKLAQGRQKPIKEIAKETGLSEKEVSSAINDVFQASIADDLRRLRMARDAARAQAENPPLQAQSLESAIDYSVGADMTDEEMLKWATERAYEKGFGPASEQGKWKTVKRKPSLFNPPTAAGPKPKATPPASQPPSDPFGPLKDMGGSTKGHQLELPAKGKPLPIENQGTSKQTGPGDMSALDPQNKMGENRVPAVSPDRYIGEPAEVSVRVGADMANPEDMARLARIAQAATSSPLDMIKEVWINNILSGPATHAANITGNAVSGAWDFTMQRGMEALWNLAANDSKGATFGEMGHIMKALAPGMAKGFRLMAKAWNTESDFFGHDVLSQQSELFEMGPQGEKIRAAIGGTKGRIIRIPGRALMAMDGFFKGLFGQMEAAAQAYRIAKSEKLTGEALQTRINTLVSTPNSRAWQLAVEKATELTFQEKMPEIVQLLQRGLNMSRVGSFVIPFVRTPYNIFRTGIRKSPVGIANLGWHVLKHGLAKIDATGKAGRAIGGLGIKTGVEITTAAPAQMVRWLAEQTFAMAGMALLWGAAAGDDDDDKKQFLITGSPPRDKGLKALNDRAVGGGYQIKIGGMTINYGRIEPIATVLGTMIDGIKAVKSGATKGATAAAILDNLKGQVMNKTFLQGLAGIIDGLERPGKWDEKAKNSLMAAIVPNLIRQPLRNADETVRDYGTADWWYPAWPSADNAGSPVVDPMTGEDKTKGGNVISRMVQQPVAPRGELTAADRVLLEYNRANPAKAWAPDPPDRGITYRGQSGSTPAVQVDLNKGAYQAYQKRTAFHFQRELGGRKFSVDDDGVKQIKNLYDKAKDRAREELRRLPVSQLGTVK